MFFRRIIISFIIGVGTLASGVVAQASPIVTLGHYYVAKNSSLSVNVPVSDSGNAATEDIEGMTITLQIANGTGSLPAISSMNFLTGTIWSGQVSATDVIPAAGGNLPQFQSDVVLTDTEGQFVNANGTLATVNFSSVGAAPGDYTLKLVGTKNSSDSKFSDGLGNTVSSVFINGTLTVVAPGDFNRDLHVDASDILPMMQALTNPAAYETTHGNLTNAQLTVLGDVNNDGKFNNADLQSLLTLLKTGGGSINSVPEPSSLILLALAIPAALGRARKRVQN
jgi:hypothetical protein